MMTRGTIMMGVRGVIMVGVRGMIMGVIKGVIKLGVREMITAVKIVLSILTMCQPVQPLWTLSA